MQRRIADIVTRFRATGLNTVRSSIQVVTRTIQGADRIINRLGAGLRVSIFVSATFAIQKMTLALRAAGRVGLATTRTIVTGLGRVTRAAAKGVGKAGVAAGIAGAASIAGRAALVGKAAKDTLEDLKPLRQMSSLLGLSIDRMSGFQLYAERAGVATDDLRQIVSGFAAAVADANDPTTEIAKRFASLGLSTKDARGRARPMIDVMYDLARATKNLDSQARNAILNPIFGDDDALKVSELLDKMAADRPAGMRKEFARSRDDGLIVTEEDVARSRSFERAILSLQRVWKVFKRELFNVFEPVLTSYATLATQLFGKGFRGQIIERYFVKPFNQLADIAHDVLKVFFGIDSAVMKIGRGLKHFSSPRALGMHMQEGWTYELKEGQNLKFPWLVEVREGLKVILGLAKGLLSFFAKMGPAAGDAIKAFSEATTNADGASLWDRFKDLKPEDIVAAFGRMGDAVQAFARDLRRLASIQMIDPATIETSLARSLLAAGVKFQSVAAQLTKPIEARFDALETRITGIFTRIRDYIVGAWQEANTALQSGEGLKAVDGSLAQIIYLAGGLLFYIVGIVRAIEALVAGQPVGSDFLWVKTLYDGAKYIWESFKQLTEALAPLKKAFDELSKAVFGLNGIVLFIIAGAIAKLLLVIGQCIRQLVLLYTTVAGSAFITAFRTGFAAAQAAGATFFAAMRAGAAAMWTAMAASAAPFIATLGVILVALTAIAAAIAVVVAGWKYFKSLKDGWAADKELADYNEKYDAYWMNEGLKRNGGNTGIFAGNAKASEYFNSPKFNQDLAAATSTPPVDRTGRPVKIFFNNEEVGDLAASDDQVDRLMRTSRELLSF